MELYNWFVSWGLDGYALAALFLQCVGAYFYIRDLRRGENDARWVSIAIWVVVESALALALYFREGKLNGQVLGGATCSVVILFFVAKRVKLTLDLEEKICFVLALVGIVGSLLMRSAVWMIFLALMVIAIGGYSTLRSAWYLPRTQSWRGWSFFALSGAPVFLSLPAYTFVEVAQPLVYTAINLGVLVFILIRTRMVSEEEEEAAKRAAAMTAQEVPAQ